jgi:hypothetical protein
MNRLLEEELAKKVAEKHGNNWELTSFMRDAWNSIKEEVISDAMKLE